MILRFLSFGLLAVSWLAIGAPVLADAVEAKPSEQETLAGPTALTVEDGVAQIEAAKTAEITDVQVNSTAAGITITLISDQPLSVGNSRISGNALITEIPDATLNLADESAAEQFAPAEGIALVQASNLADGGVRVVITGVDAPPEVQVSAEAGNLVLSVVLGTAQANVADDTIQLTVTGEQDEEYNPSTASVGTRTNTPLLDVPASIQVIPEAIAQ